MSADSDAIIDKLARTWESTVALCASLAEPEWKMPTDCPGWSVQDIISHLIGTERDLQGLPTVDHASVLAAGWTKPDWVHNAIGEANEREVEARRHLPGAMVLDEFRTLVAARLDRLRSMSDDDFDVPSFTPLGPGTLLDFLHVRVLDCWVHEQDIRRALGRAGHGDGPAAEHTIDRLWKTLAATIGRRARTPDGSTVEVLLTGPVHRHGAWVLSDGRALPTAPGPEATTRIALTSDVFLALVTGRLVADEVAVTIEGDEVIGRLVLDALNVMI